MNRIVISNMFLCHFLDPDLEVEIIFKKDAAAEGKGELVLKYGIELLFILGIEENFMLILAAFYCFLKIYKIRLFLLCLQLCVYTCLYLYACVYLYVCVRVCVCVCLWRGEEFWKFGSCFGWSDKGNCW